MLPNVSGEFRLASDPELRFTPSGAAVATATIVANSRKKEGDEWVDDKVCWLRINCWKQLAENFAETFVKGDLVVVLNGRLETREYEHEGEKRRSYEITAFDLGPSIRYATAKIEKTERKSTSSEGAPPPPAEDPWTSTPGDEPPF